MKKSQLKNIIKESIKELMTEQTSPGTLVGLTKHCDSSLWRGIGGGVSNEITSGGGGYGYDPETINSIAILANYCWEGNLQVGDTMTVTGHNYNPFDVYGSGGSNWTPSYNVGETHFVAKVWGPCNNINNSNHGTISVNPLWTYVKNDPSITCPYCCNCSPGGANDWQTNPNNYGTGWWNMPSGTQCQDEQASGHCWAKCNQDYPVTNPNYDPTWKFDKPTLIAKDLAQDMGGNKGFKPFTTEPQDEDPEINRMQDLANIRRREK